MGRRERKRYAKSWRGGKKEKGREREPVIIYFTTLFRPLLARLRRSDFGCQTVEMSMSWNLSQISREIISRGASPLCEAEQSGV